VQTPFDQTPRRRQPRPAAPRTAAELSALIVRVCAIAFITMLTGLLIWARFA
jgi:hypothetical protein